MAYTNDGKNEMLDALGVLITYVGLLDELDAEISGGSPAYARKAITWSAADAGEMAASNTPEFDVPASTTVAKVIFMSADSGGTKYAEADVDDEVFTNQGTYTLTTVTLDLNAV
jgi:hypothetical protein